MSAQPASDEQRAARETAVGLGYGVLAYTSWGLVHTRGASPAADHAGVLAVQHSAPSLQFGLAVVVYGEPFTAAHQQSFACIWAGLLLFSIDSWNQARNRRLARRAIRAASTADVTPPGP
jgi:hypothetical protein